MTTTKYADSVRDYVLNCYVTPARKQNRTSVTFKSGDIAKALKMTGRMPGVCSAVEQLAFRTKHGLKLTDRTGPHNGATVQWTFSI